MSMIWNAQAKLQYATLWNSLKINPERVAEAQKTAKKIFANKSHYMAVEAVTGVPWWLIGVLHMRESNCDLRTYLGNGQSLDEVTTQVPEGRGPWSSFEDGAIDAMRYEGFDKVKDWSMEHALFLAETFNGPGYHNKGLPSPYIVGGSNKQKPGKYTEDHGFDATIMDSQLGVACMLQALIQLGLVALGTANPAQQNTGAGITVAPTTTTTNFMSAIVGAIMAAVGGQSFGADAFHTIGAIGGAIVTISALLNQLHVVNASNSNTLNTIGSLLSQVGTLSQQPQTGAKPDQIQNP
jgi:lysozyme family protein